MHNMDKSQKEIAAATQNLNDAINAATNAKSALDKANMAVPDVKIPSITLIMSMHGSRDFIYDYIYGSDAAKNANAAIVTAQVVHRSPRPKRMHKWSR